MSDVLCEVNPGEYYKLIDCSTGADCLINGKPAAFKFNGEYHNGCHPDALFAKVLSSITTTGLSVKKGCFKFVEASYTTQLCGIEYQDFFYKVTICSSCSECHKNDPIVHVHEKKIIHATFTTPGETCPEDVQDVMCSFSNEMYQDMQQKRLGIKYCCPMDILNAKINYGITTMDLASEILFRPVTYIPPAVVYPNTTCVFTLNEIFAAGYTEFSIIIDGVERFLPMSGSVLDAGVYAAALASLNLLGLGTFTVDFSLKTITVVGTHSYESIIFTSGNSFVSPPSAGLSYLFNPVCTLV